MKIKQTVTTVPIILHIPEDVHEALLDISHYSGKSVSELAQAAFALGFTRLPSIKSLLKKVKK